MEAGQDRSAGPVEQPVVLPEGSWWDWDVFSWRPGELRLAAGYDLSYHHGLELVFADPLYVRCPAGFQDPVFRAPAPEERRLVERQCGEPPGVLVAFEADGGGAEPVSGLIAAGSLEVRVGLVLRYGRGAEPDGRPPGQKSDGRRPGQQPDGRPPGSCHTDPAGHSRGQESGGRTAPPPG